MRIGELSNNVPCNRPHSAQRLDLIFQGAELLPLRGFDKPAQVIENSTQAPLGEAVLCAMRVHDPFASIETAGIIGFGEPLVGLFEPYSVVWIMDEVDPPVLVYDCPADDRLMIARVHDAF